jgi:AbrB family looped-hinge helix DNA binding protein
MNMSSTYHEDLAMKKRISVVTRKGQITIPADIRHALGLKEGDTVAFKLKGAPHRQRGAHPD